jgi:chromosome segregation ATPase
LTLFPAHPYARGVPGLHDDEGSFAAGRQSLLDALQSLEQRTHERAERTVREAERAARQLALDSEQRAYQVTADAEERARQMLAEAEQRVKQITTEAAQRLADLEQQLTEVRDNLEFARAQMEEQVVTVSGRVEVARASLNTVRQQLTTGAGRAVEPMPKNNPMPRPTIPRLSADTATTAPNLNDLRAAVDALKKPRKVEPAPEVAPPLDNEATEPSTTTHESPTLR